MAVKMNLKTSTEWLQRFPPCSPDLPRDSGNQKSQKTCISLLSTTSDQCDVDVIFVQFVKNYRSRLDASATAAQSPSDIFKVNFLNMTAFFSTSIVGNASDNYQI